MHVQGFRHQMHAPGGVGVTSLPVPWCSICSNASLAAERTAAALQTFSHHARSCALQHKQHTIGTAVPHRSAMAGHHIVSLHATATTKQSEGHM
jgi:hypothetical protein